MHLDKQIQQALQRIAGLIKTGSRPYLVADHLALSRMGPLSVQVLKDNNVTYVDNPATHWVLDSFVQRAQNEGWEPERAKHATSVMNELLQLNQGVNENLTKTQAAIGERIEQRKATGEDPAAAEWVEKFRTAWSKRQPMTISGDLDFDGYPDSPASPSPQRYLNSFLSLIDALPNDAEIVLLSGSSAIISNVVKFEEEQGHIHTVVVDEKEVSSSA
ncbi:hypothetical protein CcaverHIS002_0401030 [Cutaneotrichosporon cavernicola]|uniref:Uncharacterized protein n=1 Tax=Cutaneotrichosporon cavernicola TaxID=279322 RepID=A0AA48L3H6_9TREE|nr:uncharacterized protein CcaverHIS019_0401000 [Cutaneotrichosporon cavernicola]BEI83499.1 hypothetical protein CcaverHIS002_0401030 [Cutaneotrichosporon cavernicola]BEI91280.1 hypothetical protein CcaverHIS019_0401000 [Cutaneotrichosporon cavernicola]BEI99053.1 hypothetical protein CcaverHIS631_0400960 [Cutaneotrichosporon cavernicola]BEJ06827.1 hypothetical protein CcaverHIS641_0400960 [Cutaneotrichosporon cavernicola]